MIERKFDFESIYKKNKAVKLDTIDELIEFVNAVDSHYGSDAFNNGQKWGMGMMVTYFNKYPKSFAVSLRSGALTYCYRNFYLSEECELVDIESISDYGDLDCDSEFNIGFLFGV